MRSSFYVLVVSSHTLAESICAAPFRPDRDGFRFGRQYKASPAFSEEKPAGSFVAESQTRQLSGDA